MTVSVSVSQVKQPPAELRHLRSGLEVNLIRLLHRCEQRALNEAADVATDWRQHRYIACLKDILNKLQAGNPIERPSTEDLSEYKRRVAALESNLETMKASVASQNTQIDQTGETFRSNIDSIDTCSYVDECGNVIENSVLKSVGDCRTVKQTSKQSREGSGASGQAELQAKTSVAPLKSMRNELLGGNSIELRRRNTKTFDLDDDETVEAILSRHNARQEKIAEEMLKLVRGLKHSSETANEIIKRDQQNLNQANSLAASNYDKLTLETLRVSKTKPLGCQWWLFALLGIVCLIFMWVVFLIKIT